jgi:hypothetical protein
MAIESLKSVVRPEARQANEKLKHVKSLTLHALDWVRRLTLDLRPSVLDDLGLVAAVRSCSSSHLGDKGVRVEFDPPDFAEGLKSGVAILGGKVIRLAAPRTAPLSPGSRPRGQSHHPDRGHAGRSGRHQGTFFEKDKGFNRWT